MKSIDSIICPYCEQRNAPHTQDVHTWEQICAYCKNKLSVEIIKDEEGVYYFEATKINKV